MPDVIRDGRGKGNLLAGVTEDNNLMTLSTIIDIRHHTAHVHQKTFAINIQQTPSAPNTPFFYIRNTSSAEDMTLWNMRIRVASNETIEVKGPILGTVTGTIYNPVNLYVGSGRVAECDVLVSNSLSGITGAGNVIRRLYIPANNTSNEFSFSSGIIIPTNSAVAFYAVSGSIQVDTTITIDFHLTE